MPKDGKKIGIVAGLGAMVAGVVLLSGKEKSEELE